MISIIYYLFLFGILFILFISFTIIKFLFLTFFLATMIVVPYLFQLFKLKSRNNKLDNITSNPQINDLDKKYKRKLAYLILNNNSRKENSTKHIKQELLYTGLGYTIADIGFKKALRYGVGYYMIRKLVRKKANKVIE